MTVRPPIPCKGDGPTAATSFVTRVPDPVRLPDPGDPASWKVDATLLSKLQEIDPEQAFFYGPVACEIGELTAENRADGITDALLPYAERMRYAPGGTWSSAVYRDRRWYELGRKERILASTAPRTEAQIDHLKKAVTLLHANRITHGDLHDENILIAADGLPRLIDFERGRIYPPGDRNFETDVVDELTNLKTILEGRISTSKPKSAGRRKTYRRKKKRRHRVSGASSRRRS